MQDKFNFRRLAYIATFVSGAIGLIFQVVWQRYLSYLVGSEGRSISLVVAVFLFGLASGYWYWGRYTQGKKSRQELARFYGLLEIGIGLYAIVFPNYYSLVESLGVYLPGNIVTDIFLACLLLFPPTFLMGATVPLLTTALPEKNSEVNFIHSKIYGINTLGAFLGVFLGSYCLIPRFGLSMSLLLGGLVAISVGIVFYRNQLSGEIKKNEDMPIIENDFSPNWIYLFVFVVGSASIALEVLLIRVLDLTIGSNYSVFPIVLGTFVLGLAIGSLTLYKKSMTLKRMQKTLLWIPAYMVFFYWTMQFWPHWIYEVRILLTNRPPNFAVFYSLCFILLSLLTFPFLVPMGRLLPVGYALAKKDSSNYGKVCGRIYFFNTLGTVFGSIVLGYLNYYFFGLDTNIKIVILMMSLLALRFVWKAGQKYQITSIALIVVALIIPRWERGFHIVGLFRERAPIARIQSGWFFVDREIPKFTPFFEDGPNSTVGLYENQRPGEDGKAVVVNGKSDSSTFGDYGTLFLLAGIPYYYVDPNKTELNAAVIGLGTGMTAGFLASGRDLKSVDVLEISESVGKAAARLDKENFQVLKNPKVTLHTLDAFKYFARLSKKLDIVISEPSNPWVQGIENLFTPEFYSKVSKNLTDGGVFIQWMHNYEISNNTVALIFRNLSESFAHLRLYSLISGDIAILASQQPLREEISAVRSQEALFQHAHERINLSAEQIPLLKLMDTNGLRLAGLRAEDTPHRLDTPRLNYLAGIDFFLGSNADPIELVDRDFRRRSLTSSPVLKRVVIGTLKPGCHSAMASSICKRISDLQQIALKWKLLKSKFDFEALTEYGILRDQGLMDPDLDFLHSCLKQLANRPSSDASDYMILAEQISKEDNAELDVALATLIKNRFNKDSELLQKFEGRLQAQKEKNQSLDRILSSF